jgi:anti-anti-sigma factor
VAKTSVGDRLVVSLSGECDLTTRAELAAVLDEAIKASPAVVVDLSELTFIDSSGIHELIVGFHAARSHGGELFVRNAQGAVAVVLDLTGVAQLLMLPGPR